VISKAAPCRQAARPGERVDPCERGAFLAGDGTASVLAKAGAMLHVRVVSPAELTDQVVASLSADPGVVNLVVARGAASKPDGDAVQFDLTTGSANSVLRQLRALGLYRRSSVIVDPVDAVLADRSDAAVLGPSYHGDRSPVWDVVEARIRDNAQYAPSFFALLVLAALIGACGILTNSQTLIVGAMVVGPEYSAIISVALGIDRRDRRPVGTGLRALAAGFLLAIAVTLLFALSIRWSGHTPKLYHDGLRPVSDLINSPNLFSVVVAVIAGVVGVISLTLAKAGVLIGVFISVTTIPAAADVGVSLAYGSWRQSAGSVEQLVLNVGLLIIVGALAIRGQRRIWRRLATRTRRSALARPQPRVTAEAGFPDGAARGAGARTPPPTLAPRRSAMCSPTRMPLAIAVSAGFTAPMLGKKLVSVTYRLSTSCALQFTSSTEVAGSVPKRHVPAWWATAATGMFMLM
jgi:uncharacterized hydrophobic protein (TIGR00271 family)